MNQWKRAIFGALAMLAFGPAGMATIALGQVHGVVQSVNVREGTIAVAGHTYAVGKGTSVAGVAGVAGLPHLRPGETVSVLLGPDGKHVLRVAVVPTRDPLPSRH